MPVSSGHSLPELHCLCATIRRASRLVTQLYSHQMGPGPEPSQFSLLSALRKLPGASQGSLGLALGLDKTTMSRNMKVMKRSGWIEASRTEDKRERGYRLTTSGEQVFKSTQLEWMRAQTKLRKTLRPGEWERALLTINRVAEAAFQLER